MNSSQLFSAMPPATAASIVEYIHGLDKTTYRTALDGVAQARKVRPVFLERMPRTERFAFMAAALGRTDLMVIANSLLSTWLVKKHIPMLSEFLDALQVKHENGVVEDLPKSVEDAALERALETLLSKYPPVEVAIYLNAFNDMNEARWENLELHLQTDPRLQLKRG